MCVGKGGGLFGALIGAFGAAQLAGGSPGTISSIVGGPTPLVPAMAMGAGQGALIQNQTNEFRMDIHPTPGMDEEKLSSMVVEKISEVQGEALQAAQEDFSLERP